MNSSKNMRSFFKKYFKIIGLVLSIVIIGFGGYHGYRLYLHKPTTQDIGPVTVAPDEVRGKTVILRKLKESYFIDYHNMFSQDVRHNIEAPEFVNLDYTIRYLTYEMDQCKNGEQLLYCIFDAKENRLIGEINIREENNNGQFGCWINEHYRGGGRIQEAVKLITDVYFQLHDKPFFIAHVRLWNKRSYKALLKSGFIDTKKFYYEDGEPTRYLLEFHRKK